MQMMLMMFVPLMQLRAGASANDALTLVHWAQIRAGAGATDAHDARPSGATEGQVWGK